jgi:hypothetical protein
LRGLADNWEVNFAANLQARQLALIGVLAALALALGAFTLTRARSDETQAGAVQASATGTGAGVARPKVSPRAARRAAALANGAPAAVATSLADHAVAVISIVSSGSAVSRKALVEARAGARASHAGFVAFNISREGQAQRVAALGVLEDPAVFVYRRPGRLSAQLQGFVDRQTVAQAVDNAR